MPEFPWRCPQCDGDEIHYSGVMRFGWFLWECRSEWPYRHMFVTIQY